MRINPRIGTAVIVLTIVAGTITAIGPDARHQFGTMLGLAPAAPVAEAELPGLVEQAEKKMGKTFAQSALRGCEGRDLANGSRLTSAAPRVRRIGCRSSMKLANRSG